MGQAIRMKKTIDFLASVILFGVHALFLLMIIIEHNDDPKIILLTSIIAGLMLTGYLLKNHNHILEKKIGDFWLTSVLIGAFATYGISLYTNAAIASSFIGLVGSFLPEKKISGLNISPAAIYCGSFVGMTSFISELDTLLTIGLGSIFTAIIFWRLQHAFTGYGGKLGSIAFGGSVIGAIIVEWI